MAIYFQVINHTIVQCVLGDKIVHTLKEMKLVTVENVIDFPERPVEFNAEINYDKAYNLLVAITWVTQNRHILSFQ